MREYFPAARDANLLKSTVIKEVNATYSPRPGIDAYRPKAETSWPRIFLAGDWTATGWPATMEGAVSSGYRAAECVAGAARLRGTTSLYPIARYGVHAIVRLRGYTASKITPPATANAASQRRRSTCSWRNIFAAMALVTKVNEVEAGMTRLTSAQERPNSMA